MKPKSQFVSKVRSRAKQKPKEGELLECKQLDCIVPRQPQANFRKIGGVYMTICKTCEKKREQKRRDERKQANKDFI